MTFFRQVYCLRYHIFLSLNSFFIIKRKLVGFVAEQQFEVNQSLRGGQRQQQQQHCRRRRVRRGILRQSTGHRHSRQLHSHLHSAGHFCPLFRNGKWVNNTKIFTFRNTLLHLFFVFLKINFCNYFQVFVLTYLVLMSVDILFELLLSSQQEKLLKQYYR